MGQEFAGVVAAGHGAARRDVHAGMYLRLDADLYPGTLNVELGEVPLFDYGARWTLPHPDGYSLHIWKARLVAPQPVCDVFLMWPHRNPQETHVELLHTRRLRFTHRLADGDAVRIEVL